MSKDYENQPLMGAQPAYNPAGPPPPQQQPYYPPPQQKQQPYYQQQPPQGYAPYQHQSPSSPVFINNNVAPAPASPTVIFAGGPNQGGCASGNHQMVERTKAMGWVWCILCWWNPVCWVCLCRKKHTCRQCGYSPDAGPCGA